MQFQTMGTVSSYIKMVKLDMKYQKRKENPWLKKGDENEDPNIRRIKEQAEQTRISNTLESLMGKVKAGLRLSGTEMEYLRENHPDAYKQVLEIEKERAEYRRELEQCKTKEDVRKLNQRKLTQFQAEAKAITSNPNIPRDQKAGLLEKIQMRMANIQNEHAIFINTPEYKAMPEDDREDKEKRGDAGLQDDDRIKDLLRDVKLGDSEDELEGLYGYETANAVNEAGGETTEAGDTVNGEISKADTADKNIAVSSDCGSKPGGKGMQPAEKAPAFNQGHAYNANGSRVYAPKVTAHSVSVKV